jgi:hypothetical protein
LDDLIYKLDDINMRKRDLKSIVKEKQLVIKKLKKSKTYNSSYNPEIKALPETNALLLLMKLYGHEYKD